MTSISEIDDRKLLTEVHVDIISCHLICFQRYIYVGVEICWRMIWPVFSTLGTSYEASLALNMNIFPTAFHPIFFQLQ